MTRKRGQFMCKDCGLDTLDEYYMVHDAIWKQSGLPPLGGILCIGCLETRIGRKLVGSDFTACPVNEGYFPRSQRHLERLAS